MRKKVIHIFNKLKETFWFNCEDEKLTYKKRKI